MINLRRILKRLPKYDDPAPATAKTEQQQVLDEIALALETGGYNFTSRRSIRIYRLNAFEGDGLEVRSIEVEWKLND